jgi:hypothetical protein
VSNNVVAQATLATTSLRAFIHSALLWLLAAGCTSARSNARLQPGLSGGVTLAAAYFPADRGDSNPNGRDTAAASPAPEAFVQIARTDGTDSGTAIQLTVPLAYAAAAVDVYHQFSGSERWSHGGGVEFGLLTGGGYYLVTGHAGSLYATATARLLALWDDWQPVLTTQLAFGRQRRVDLFGFVAYTRALGDAIDLGVDQTYSFRAWLLAGFGLRF